MIRRIFRRFDWFKVLAYTVVIVFALCCLLPFWLVISGSLTDEAELINHGYVLWPHTFSTASYQFLLAGGQVATSYGISIFITVVGTTLALAITSGLAYAIAMLRPRVGRPLGFFVYFPMLFSGGLVPFYLLVTQVLQLQDSLWAVILPLMVNPFFVFIMVSFFRQIPREIIESGRMDGANAFVIFVRLVLPISTPVLATIALFYALTYWNDWFMAILFIGDNTKFPLQLLLQNMIANVDATQALQYSSAIQVPSYQLRMALTLMTIGPIIFVYPFLQRYFVKGLTLGAAKG
jgi:putative aldouronate transport system permease protein